MRILIGWMLGITTAYVLDLSFQKLEKRYWRTWNQVPREEMNDIERIIYLGEVPENTDTFENDTVNLRQRRWFGL